MSQDRPVIEPAPFCKLHQLLLVHQCGFKETDPWRALMIMAQIAIFQGATTDPQLHEKTSGDITKIKEIGCLACFKPDLFGELIEEVNSKGMSAIKSLGESWMKRNG